MCFVRKGLDWVFTRDELMHLDDVLPEEHKREKEDKKKKEKDDKLRPNKEVRSIVLYCIVLYCLYAYMVRNQVI